MAYQVGTFEAPSEICVANIDGRGERQLTHVHDAFTSEIALSKSRAPATQERATARRSKAFLLYPYGYRPGTAARIR